MSYWPRARARARCGVMGAGLRGFGLRALETPAWLPTWGYDTTAGVPGQLPFVGKLVPFVGGFADYVPGGCRGGPGCPGVRGRVVCRSSSLDHDTRADSPKGQCD